MESSVIAKAEEMSGTIREATRRHSFEHAVGEFVQLLASVLDFPAAEFSNDGIKVLSTLAEGVIECIEQRVSANKDPAADQQKLVGSVYEIRRVLEEIDRWRSHFLGT